jgi:predicted O-linked N-acetylglucosamine transferase (SPINDLY family)
VNLTLPQALEQAIDAYVGGHLDRAEELSRLVLLSDSRNSEALHLLGVITAQSNRAGQSLVLLSKCVEISPDNSDAHCDLGNLLRILGRVPEGLEHLERSISLQPGNAAAFNNRGLALHALKRYPEAVDSFGRAIALAPDYAEAFTNRGVTYRALKQPAEALKDHEKAVTLMPYSAEASFECGLSLLELQRFPEALACADRAISSNPGYARAHVLRGDVLAEIKRSIEALVSYDRALAIDPSLAEAHNNRGNALFAVGRQTEALDAYAHAIALRPDFADAQNNRGNVLHALGRHLEALEGYELAIGHRPDFAEALNNRGSALHKLNRLTEALESFEKAIQIRPDNAHAFNNRGAVLQSLNRHTEAVASYEKAIALAPEHAEAHSNRGIALTRLKRHAEALTSFQRAVALNPKIDLLPGNLLMAQMKLCDWTDFEFRLKDLEERIWRGENATPPYAVLASSNCLKLQRKAAENFVAKCFPPNLALGAMDKGGERTNKIRIAYFSGDFRTHATSYLTADLFETHDKSRFDLTGFYFGPDTHDDMRRRVSAAFDRFIDVRAKSDQEIAQLSRNLEIDIAVDLMGFTEHSRTGIFACRAAPIQVIYLGYPGTMGADYIDYVIADEKLIPDASRKHFSEKIALLPHCFQPNDRRRQVSDRTFTRGELGLPPSGFVFCCFHSSYKITRTTFDSWLRILRKVRGSVLWLREETADAAGNLRAEAERNGVAAERLVFAPRMEYSEHLTRHRQADLFLDTFPFNAHTTASDALWVGLPVLTRAGETYISRVAASLLSTIGLTELITHTQDDYEQLAIDLAANPERLMQIRRKLIENRVTSPLFDTPRYARHLEAAYAKMHERHRAGLPPDHIEVCA